MLVNKSAMPLQKNVITHPLLCRSAQLGTVWSIKTATWHKCGKIHLSPRKLPVDMYLHRTEGLHENKALYSLLLICE